MRRRYSCPRGRRCSPSGDRVVELDLEGEVLQELGLAESELPASFAVDDGGGIYIAGRAELEEWVYRPWILRVERDFTRAWEVIDPREGSLSAVAVGPMGDAFVVGSVEAPPAAGQLDYDHTDVWIGRYAR